MINIKTTMMKTGKLMMGVLMIGMLFVGCKKSSERIVDCFGESLKLSVHVTVNPNNAKQVSTEVKYWGEKKISGIKWEYGDGATETTTGLTGNHLYASAGTYTVKARVTFTEGKSSCEVDPTKAVTIQ